MKNVTTTKARLPGLDAMDFGDSGSGAFQYTHSTRPPAQGGNERKRDRTDTLPKRTDKGRGRVQGGDKRPFQGSPGVPGGSFHAGYAVPQNQKKMTRIFLNYNNLPEALILLWLLLVLATTRLNTGGIQAPMTNEVQEAVLTPSDVRAAIDSGRKELHALKEKRAPKPVKLISPRFGEVE